MNRLLGRRPCERRFAHRAGRARGDVAPSAASAPSIAGDWVWSHRTVFVVPTPVAATVVPEAVYDHDGCLNLGSLLVTDGVVTGWRATGACEIPVPVQPAVAKTIIRRAERV